MDCCRDFIWTKSYVNILRQETYLSNTDTLLHIYSFCLTYWNFAHNYLFLFFETIFNRIMFARIILLMIHTFLSPPFPIAEKFWKCIFWIFLNFLYFLHNWPASSGFQREWPFYVFLCTGRYKDIKSCIYGLPLCTGGPTSMF